MQKRCSRAVLSVVMFAALFLGVTASGWHSGGGYTVAYASGAETPYIINLKEGSSSGYGQQAVSFTDQKGKTVNLQEEAERVSGVSSEDILASMPSLYADANDSFLDNRANLMPVRNQGQKNLCWAFSATGLLEANILNHQSDFPSVDASSVDLSERHLAWFSHNTKSTLADDPTKGTDGVRKASPGAAYTGGNYYQVEACLARGSGMTLEEALPYNGISLASVPETDRYDSLITLHDSYSVNYDMDKDPTGSVGRVKNLVKAYGAAGFSYLSKEAYYTDKTAPGGTAYYQKSKGSNHAACIVGYRDDYPASNFTGKGGQPPKDGAWLCRNSWGSNWGDNGYFWLSYYDASICHVYAFNAADSTKYGDIYQYDAKGMGAYIGVNGSANIFQARKKDELCNVGIYIASAIKGGKIEVYTSKTKPSSPESGDLANTTTIDTELFAGYHVIELSGSVGVDAGDYFSVVLTLNDAGSSAMYAFEGKKGCKAAAGQSFYKLNGSWQDSYKLVKNACIKAIMSSSGTDTTQLQELRTQADGIPFDSPINGWAQKEKKAADAVMQSKRADDVASAVKRMERLLSHTDSKKLYVDATKSMGPGAGGANLYLNGGTYKKDGVVKKYGAQSYYFTVDKVKSWKKKGLKMVSAYVGKYVAGVTLGSAVPTLNANGLIDSDAQAEQILKVKVSGTKLTVKPLAKSTVPVYVWVMYSPKGGKDSMVNKDEALDYAMMKVTVGDTAPSAVKLYNTADKAKSCTDTKVVQYKSTVMPQDGSTDVYVAGTTGKKSALAACELDGTNYEAVVPVKYKDYITVKQDETEKNKFTITAASDILDQFKISANRSLTVKIPFCCIRNNKKAIFKVVISNPVVTMDFKAGIGTTTNLITDGADKILEVKIPAATEKEASTGNIVETKTVYTEKRICTDKTKVLRMADKADIRFNASNVLGVSTKLTPQQKKVTMTLQKGQDAYLIKAAKGTEAGTSVYFVIYHNAYEHVSGKGYQIVKVTVGQAETTPNPPAGAESGGN